MKWRPNMKIKLMNDENFNDVLEQHRWHHGYQLPLYILLFLSVIRKCESLFVDIHTEDETHRCTSSHFMKMYLISYEHTHFLWKCASFIMYILDFYKDVAYILSTSSIFI